MLSSYPFCQDLMPRPLGHLTWGHLIHHRLSTFNRNHTYTFGTIDHTAPKDVAELAYVPKQIDFQMGKYFSCCILGLRSIPQVMLMPPCCTNKGPGGAGGVYFQLDIHLPNLSSYARKLEQTSMSM